MIPASEYVAPERRVPEVSTIEGNWEFVGRYSGYATRTRWVTQRTLQAVGTGWLFGHWFFPMRWLAFPLIEAKPYSFDWFAKWSAKQSARIGFGDL